MPHRSDLQIRAGARFSCGNDGLCCSDVHALGPLTRAESERIAGYDPEAVVRHPRLGLIVLSPRADHTHTCRFFDFDDGCRIHREHGGHAKPAACRQFPFGLVDTPSGKRVTTAHRCPCRTMGRRSPLDVEEARASLAQPPQGRLRVDQTVGPRVRLARGRSVGWKRYLTIETRVLDSIQRGTLTSTLMAMATLPPIRDATWADVAHSHRAMVDGSTTGDALGWFGDALLYLIEGKRLGDRTTPWAWSFARAERRVVEPRGRMELYADFAADRIYGLRWAEESSLAGELLSLSVALRAVDAIATTLLRARLGERGIQEERAAAEAVMIAEVALSGPLSHVRFESTAETEIIRSRIDVT